MKVFKIKLNSFLKMELLKKYEELKQERTSIFGVMPIEFPRRNIENVRIQSDENGSRSLTVGYRSRGRSWTITKKWFPGD